MQKKLTRNRNCAISGQQYDTKILLQQPGTVLRCTSRKITADRDWFLYCYIQHRVVNSTVVAEPHCSDRVTSTSRRQNITPNTNFKSVTPISNYKNKKSLN